MMSELTYPPRCIIDFPNVTFIDDNIDLCDLWDTVDELATLINPCFNVCQLSCQFLSSRI